jgi:hypothetical protein
MIFAKLDSGEKDKNVKILWQYYDANDRQQKVLIRNLLTYVPSAQEFKVHTGYVNFSCNFDIPLI